HRGCGRAGWAGCRGCRTWRPASGVYYPRGRKPYRNCGRRVPGASRRVKISCWIVPSIERSTIMAVAVPEILMVLLLLGGPAGSDLVTVLDPTMYFQARQIDLSIDKMASLAGAAPENG